IRYSLYNLISIDAHGHEETTGRGEDFTFWDTASDSLQLLSKLGLDEFYVLETTQGGFTAFRMALPEPYRSRDTWCETKVPSDEAMLAGAASFGGPARVGEKVYEKIKQMWIKRYAEPEGYDPAFNCLLNRDGIDDKINVPTLVLHGAEDPVIPAEEAKQWSSKLPKLWKFEIVERGVHHLSLTEPGDEIAAQLVPQFIKETL
ncbi:unnamed protein product, partial [Rotaria sordida]